MTRSIEPEVAAYFAESIFDPLLDVLRSFGIEPDPNDQSRENSFFSALMTALRAGRVWFVDGVFYGKFSAAISRELRDLGAKWSDRKRAFVLALDRIPLAIRGAVAATVERARELHEAILRTIDRIADALPLAPAGFRLDSIVDKILGDLEKQFVQTVSGADWITVPADLTPAITQELQRQLTENLDLSVREFSLEKIPELRRLAAENAFAGGRADRLAELIEARFGVAKRKAAFLAEQETSLLVSKYRELRYTEIGVQRYRWSTSHDERVRPDHKLLDGAEFSFDDPPCTNRSQTVATATRKAQPARYCNPGEDFRCRCVPFALLESIE